MYAQIWIPYKSHICIYITIITIIAYIYRHSSHIRTQVHKHISLYKVLFDFLYRNLEPTLDPHFGRVKALHFCCRSQLRPDAGVEGCSGELQL